MEGCTVFRFFYSFICFIDQLTTFSDELVKIMLIKTRGIVFKTMKYSETSVIADIYTEQKGLRKYIFGGVRKKKAGVSAGLLQVMSLVEMVAYFREDRSLSRVKEIRPAHVFTNLPFEVRRGAVGLFLAEVARKTIRESEENSNLFVFLFDAFRYLDESPHPIANYHLQFLIELSGFLGFMPGGQYCAETPYFDLQEGIFTGTSPAHPHFLGDPLSPIISAFLHSNLRHCHEIPMLRENRRLLLAQLLDFYALHLENFPKIHAHEILMEVLE